MKRTDGNFNTGLYGAGEFDYSMATTSSAVAHLTSVGGTQVITSSATFLGILNGDTEFSASNAGNFGAATGKTLNMAIASANRPKYLTTSDYMQG